MFRPQLALLLLGLTAITIGCNNTSPSTVLENTNSPLSVYTVNYPLEYFAARIGGDRVSARFPGPADKDPAFWVPSSETIAEYQQADVILLNGASYAKWLPTATLPEAKLVDTSRSVRDLYLSEEDAVTHRHGSGETHSHAGTAFTVWLDPDIAVAQAHAILTAFANRRPQWRAEFEANFDALKKDLESLDAALVQAGEPLRDVPLLFSHPVFQYLERKLELQARSLHWEPDQYPTKPQWKELAKALQDHPAKWMIWEGEPAEQTVGKLRESNITSVVYSPCSQAPAKGDWLSVMEANVEALKKLSAE